MIHTMAEIVKRPATFQCLRVGVAYYQVQVPCGEDCTTYEFSVPLDDIGNATLSATEKGITLMRYIRKALQKGELLENNRIAVP